MKSQRTIVLLVQHSSFQHSGDSTSLEACLCFGITSGEEEKENLGMNVFE